MEDHDYPPQSSLVVGLKSRCPRCGEGKLFDGYLNIAPKCNKCGLDYSFIDAGDGPAVFIILIVGFIVVGLALFVEVSYQPPYWVHAVIWIPLTLILTTGLLRPFKAWLVAQQFKHKARPGQLDE